MTGAVVLEMNRRTFLVGTAGVGALAMMGVGLEGCTPGSITVPALGVAGSGSLSGTTIASRLSTLGSNAEIVRLTVDWSAIQTGPTTYNWSGIEGKISALVGAQKQILACIFFTPSWARPTGTPNTHPPSTLQDYADFCQLFCSRYKPGGSRTSVVNATYGVKFYEIWNEANSQGFWSTHTAMADDTATYSNMLRLAYDAVKNEGGSTSAVYIGTSGTAPLPKVGPAPADFLTGILDEVEDSGYTKSTYGWAALPFDFVCHHPYNWSRSSSGSYQQIDGNSNSNGFAYHTAAVNEVIKGAGITGMRIWATESGVPWNASATTGEGLLISAWQTTTSSTTGTGAGSFTVSNGASLPPADPNGTPSTPKIFLKIQDAVLGDEIVRASRSGNTLTVASGDRGMFGTSAVNHASGKTITLISPHVASRAEAANYITEMYGYWRDQTGYTTWPTTPSGYTFNASDVCGPIFHFGLQDFLDGSATNGQGGWVGDPESYYGLFNNSGSPKDVMGSSDPYDIFVGQPGGNLSAPSPRPTR